MHELSIADAVLSLVLEQAPCCRVSKVGMRIGHLRQVVPSALQFSFRLVAQETRADGAELEIEPIPVRVWCGRCDATSEPAAFPLLCDRCKTPDVSVVAGDEMLVEWIETEAA